MSEDVYFIQVEGDAEEVKEAAHSLSGFLQDMDARTIVVPDNIKPLDQDEAMGYLTAMADALDVELTDESS